MPHLAGFLLAQSRTPRKGTLGKVHCGWGGWQESDQGTTVSTLRTQCHQEPVSPTSPADLGSWWFQTKGQRTSLFRMLAY